MTGVGLASFPTEPIAKRPRKGDSRNRIDTVLHIAAPGTAGGLESVLVGLASGLAKCGVAMHVAAVVHSDPDMHPVVRELRKRGVSVHPIVVPSRGYLRERREIRRLLRSLRPDVVHTHGHRPDALDSGLARAMGIPTVTTLHGSSRMSWRTALYERLQLRILSRFDAVLAVSRPLAGELAAAGVPEDRIHIVPNAWDGRFSALPRDAARRKLDLPQDAFIVGWVGRLIPVKGCDVFLRAMIRLRDLPLHGSIIGDGPELDSLRSLAEAHGIADRIHFHGSKDAAAELFRAFDVWVLSSRSEGTPMVLFEAMAAGIPIVAADVGGVADVASGAEAFLVPPEHPEVIAGYLRAIHSGTLPTGDRVQRAKLRLADRFTTRPWVERHLEIYRELAVRNRKTTRAP